MWQPLGLWLVIDPAMMPTITDCRRLPPRSDRDVVNPSLFFALAKLSDKSPIFGQC
jgi:hypothetical protein